MSKAFTKESDGDEPAPSFVAELPLPPGAKNYVTPAGLAAYRAAVAGESDPRRQAELARRIERAEVVDPATQDTDRVRFGLVVSVEGASGARDYQIVGIDEAEPRAGRVSWMSPIARALLEATVGDVVTVQLGGKPVELEVTAIRRPEQ
jgi:transcription elongation factor GreB